jgi:ubiquinone/menaquinone biosynthesis C-methylase UbiE
MDDVEYRKMSEMEDTAWWFRGKRAVVANMIARFAPGERRLRGLDVGCGTGANLALLGRFGAAHLSLSRASALALPYPARAFGVVALLDMLYHRRVNDVTRSLTEVARVCRPGGLLVITDSAFEFLKGPHDVAYQPARRFRRHELAQLVAASGFEILR